MNIFLAGATGYIGGTVAERLRRAGHRVRGLARTEERASALRARGIEPVLGSLSDLAALTEAAREADAVISAADADHRASVDALLRGVEGSGKRFLHTSGSSIVSTDAKGELVADVFDEDTDYEPIADKADRVATDRAVQRAANQGVHSIVICPTMVYGDGLGLKVESIQIPNIEREARASGAAHWIGRGANVWSNVHVEDLADLYLLALEKAPGGAFYYAENGEADLKTVVTAVGRRLGLPAASLSIEEAARFWGFADAHLHLASNSRVRAKRARAELGWKPHHPSIVAWLENTSPPR
ncbi:NAD-dependent epimerase/dehydratase family protein [Pendulispora albinea]|uniref:NAD-dependent epimerase/dehydratase family protein n=1 Tax=Pendulispora albinea TaxID=2741071 RepID=A0ABZ2M3M1_9BACT